MPKKRVEYHLFIFNLSAVNLLLKLIIIVYILRENLFQNRRKLFSIFWVGCIFGAHAF